MSASETVKMITQTLVRLEEKVDKNTEMLFEVKAAQKLSAKKDIEMEKKIALLEKQHSECGSRNDYEKRQLKKKSRSYAIGMTSTIVGIIVGVVGIIEFGQRISDGIKKSISTLLSLIK